MRKIYKKVMKLLDARQKRQMVGIVIMMLIGGVLESMGIALIAPVMQVVVDPEQIQKSKALSFIYNGFHFSNPTQLAAFIMVMLILVFIIKNIFLY